MSHWFSLVWFINTLCVFLYDDCVCLFVHLFDSSIRRLIWAKEMFVYATTNRFANLGDEIEIMANNEIVVQATEQHVQKWELFRNDSKRKSTFLCVCVWAWARPRCIVFRIEIQTHRNGYSNWQITTARCCLVICKFFGMNYYLVANWNRPPSGRCACV